MDARGQKQPNRVIRPNPEAKDKTERMTLYRIKNWDKMFENKDTRKLKALRWVPMPNKHDGLGFNRVASQRDQCALFAAWCLMVQIASKAPQEHRGLLARDGRPLEPEDLAIMTGFPADVFKRALDFFSDPKQGWLEVVTQDGTAHGRSVESLDSTEPHDTDQVAPPTQGNLPSFPDAPGESGVEGKGREGNEGKGKNVVVVATPPETKTTSTRFAKPSLGEMKLHAAKIGLPESEAESCWHYYEANGWKVGRHGMRSWQSAMVHWRTVWQCRRPPANAPSQPSTWEIAKRIEAIDAEIKQIKNRGRENPHGWKARDETDRLRLVELKKLRDELNKKLIQ